MQTSCVPPPKFVGFDQGSFALNHLLVERNSAAVGDVNVSGIYSLPFVQESDYQKSNDPTNNQAAPSVDVRLSSHHHFFSTQDAPANLMLPLQLSNVSNDCFSSVSNNIEGMIFRPEKVTADHHVSWSMDMLVGPHNVDMHNKDISQMMQLETNTAYTHGSLEDIAAAMIKAVWSYIFHISKNVISVKCQTGI